MDERLRVLFTIPELAAGGPDRVFYELLCGLDRDAFIPQLAVSRAGGRYFSALPQDIEVCVVGEGRYPVWRFARAVDRLRPDLVVTTLRMNITAAAARMFQRHRPPLVTRPANAINANFTELRKKSSLKYGLAEWVVKRLMRKSDGLVAQSSDMKDELARLVPARKKIAVIGNPVSCEDVAAACAAQRAMCNQGPFGAPALIAVGRLAPQKGFDLLLPAFATFLRANPKAGLTILGEGPDRTALEAQSQRLGIAKSVRFPGQSDTVLAEVYAADVFVSSSRYEGFSNAILEAMALGKPVVATNSEGGTRDMVIDGETGILADAVSSESLAEALRRTFRFDLGALGEAGRIHVQKQFSRRRVLADYGAFFHEVLAAAGGRRAQEAVRIRHRKGLGATDKSEFP